MFVRTNNLKAVIHQMYGRPYCKEYGKAYVLVSSQDYEKYISKGKTLNTFGATFAIIDEKPQFVWGELNFGDYKVMGAEREESLLETMAEHNLMVSEKAQDRVAFTDPEKIMFSIGGKAYTAEETRRWQLGPWQAFLYYHDNGYSYMGTDPAKSPESFVNAAIKHVKERGYYSPSASINGFTFKDDFTCLVRIGKNEQWSEVSNS